MTKLSAMKLVSYSIWMLLAMAALMLLLARADHGGSAVTAAAEAEGNISCRDAISALLPCSGYLLGQDTEGHPSAGCCQSARALNDMTSTVGTRRQVCECFKETGPSFGVKPERARQLPQFCNLSLSIAITPDMDCSKIS